MENNFSEAEIIQKVSGGETHLFEHIVRRYQDRILRLCASMLGESNAQDAAQETFLKAYQSLKNFKGNSALATWIHRIAINHCLNKIAEKKRERAESLETLTEKEWDLPAALQVPQVDLQRLQDRQTIERAFAKMSSEYKTILLLREIQGFTYDEIAQALEISVDLVKVRLFRARKEFALLAQEDL